MAKYRFDDDLVFSLVEEPGFFRLKVDTPYIEEDHVEEFLDTTVEWLSSNPKKGILIDFKGVKSVCEDFSLHLRKYYEDIKSRGLYVRFVNVDATLERFVDVSNVTTVIDLDSLQLKQDKIVVSARQILEDLARHLSDNELMLKHGLSKRGLASLFRKLLLKGLVTRRFLAQRMGVETSELSTSLAGMDSRKVKLDASDVLDDITRKLSNAALMRKYKLSAKGLKSLLKKLHSIGLISKSTVAARTKSPE
jgi:anti-anti-sigma regulatory factor/DNA-binding HxlR family transcriptional regulator